MRKTCVYTEDTAQTHFDAESRTSQRSLESDSLRLADSIGHTIDHAYAHHIERLMVLGQFCLLLGVRPYDVHRWHISMFVDAIDWVSLPNALGMSQHADGGVIGTKPYAASGNYNQSYEQPLPTLPLRSA